MFNGLTNIGKEYIAKCLAENKPITFTKVKIGDGLLDLDENAELLTDVKSLKKEVEILDKTQEGELTTLTILLDNSDIEVGYYPREIGIYVTDDGIEKLYWYINDGLETQWLCAANKYPIKFKQIINLMTTNLESVIVNWSGKDLFVDREFVEEKIKEKVRTFEIPTIAELQSRKNLKVGDIVEVLGYYSAGDGAGHKRIISNEDDGSGVQLTNELWANIVHNGEVNVSWFGAKGDGITDDTQTIQKAMNYKANIFAQGNFLINNTIEINDRYNLNINFENTTFKYTGTNYAFKLYKITYCTFKFGKIYSNNGGGIELYSDGDAGGIYNYTQYLNIYFNEFSVKNTCFNFNFNGSWLNEIRFYNGQVKGNIGFFADSKNKDGVNGIKLHNIGFEGVGTGVWLKDGCGCWSILMPRYAEAIEPLLIKTEGVVSGLIFIGQNWLYKHYLSFSNKTQGKIISPILDKNGETQSYEAIISKGVINEINQANGYANIYNKNNIDLSEERLYDYKQPKFFLAGDSGASVTNTIKLSDKYGCDYGVNEFYLHTQYYYKESSIKIIDANGKVIFHRNNFSPNEQFKFRWHAGVDGVGKWYCEKITLVKPTNISPANTINVEKLNTLYMGEKMKQDGVYNDFIAYMDEKTLYDNQQREIEKQKQLAYQEALKENPNLTYEEFLSMQPMTLNLITPEEPQSSEALKKFMEKYL